MNTISRLVLLPGMDGTGELFRGFLAALPIGLKATVVRYPCDRVAAYPALATLIRNELPPTEPFAIVAESFSTPLAIQLAACAPGNLAGLILCAGFASSPVTGGRRRVLGFAAPVVFRIPMPRFAVRRWLVGADAPDPLVDSVRESAARVRPAVMAARLAEVLACDVRKELAHVSMPIFYLQAKRDRLVKGAAVDDIFQIKPGLEVALIDGPHLILQREPWKAAEAICEFVRRIS